MKVRPRNHKSILAAAVSAVAPLVFAPTQVHGAAVVTTATWTASTGGTLLWNVSSNWSSDPDYPSGVGAGAIINGAPATRTINAGEAITIGSIAQTNDTNFAGTIGAGGGSLTWDAVDSGPATITVNGGGTGNLTLSAPSTFNDNVVATVNAIAASSAAGALNWTGTMTGTGGFTKNGDGLLTYGTGARSYTGATVLNGGRMRMSLAAVAAQTSSFTINSGAQLDVIASGTFTIGTGPLNLNGFGPTTGPFAAFPGAFREDANLAITVTNPVVLQSNSLLHVRQTAGFTGTLTFSNVVSGPGALVITDATSDAQEGTFFLTSSTGNTYTGGTVINGGTVQVTSGAGLGTGPLTVNAITNSGIPVTVLNLSTSGPTTVGSLNSSGIIGGASATINNGGQLLTVKQTAAGSYGGAMAGAGGLALDASSNNTLALSGNLTYTGPTSVAGGNLSLATNLTASSGVAVSAGTLELAAGGGSLRVIHTPSVAVTGTGRLDIQDNKIITQTPVGTFSGGVYSDVSGMIQTGRNGGGWTGSGIVTSQSDATSGNFTSIGVATAQQVKGLANPTDTTTFAGRTVTGSDTLVMYTYGGDANLDGKINVDDYGRIDFNVNLGTSGWYNGDFNYDGKVNVDDYGIIDFNVGIQGAMFPTGASAGLSGVSAVPEPASVALLALAGTAAMNRRRRRMT